MKHLTILTLLMIFVAGCATNPQRTTTKISVDDFPPLTQAQQTNKAIEMIDDLMMQGLIPDGVNVSISPGGEVLIVGPDAVVEKQREQNIEPKLPMREFTLSEIPTVIAKLEAKMILNHHKTAKTLQEMTAYVKEGSTIYVNENVLPDDL